MKLMHIDSFLFKNFQIQLQHEFKVKEFLTKNQTEEVELFGQIYKPEFKL